jgi:hypothetical protein
MSTTYYGIMESAEALTKAAQILDEEKVRPTGSYVPKLGNDLGTISLH